MTFPATFRASLLIAALVATSAPLAAQRAPQAPAEPWTKIPIPALHAFKPVQPRRVELPNGATLLLEEDHELPFVHGRIMIRGGSRDEPADKVGLSSIYARVWRTSGTATTSGDALDDILATKAASIETSGGIATTSLSWSSLKQDSDFVLGAAVDLLLHPVFQLAKLALVKRQTMAGIARRNDDAQSIAVREMYALAYGPTSPYARHVEYATVGAVTLDDLKAFHDRTVVGANLIISVLGDFDSAAMETKIGAALGSIPKGTQIPLPQFTGVDSRPGVYFANKSDVNQSTILIAGVGIQRDNPDFYAAEVMNDIFSGGFSSRLVQNVRTRLGLAYEANGALTAAYDHPGIFYVIVGTRSPATVPATQAALEQVRSMLTQPPSASELQHAKDDLLNSFIFSYDSKDKILGEQIVLDLYHYPSDLLERYPALVQKVTASDVTRVANKYIDVSKLATVVVGNKAEITPDLTGLGKVTDLDISIPPPPASQKQKTF